MLLFEECLDAGQHIFNDSLGNRLHSLGSASLKVDGANLIAKHHALRLGTRTAQRYRETGVTGKVATLCDGCNDRET